MLCTHAFMLRHVSHIWLCNPMDCSQPGSSAMGFSRQEYRSGLPCPPPGDLPDPGIELTSLMSPALTDGFFTTRAIWEAWSNIIHILKLCTLKYTQWKKGGKKRERGERIYILKVKLSHSKCGYTPEGAWEGRGESIVSLQSCVYQNVLHEQF